MMKHKVLILISALMLSSTTFVPSYADSITIDTQQKSAPTAKEKSGTSALGFTQVNPGSKTAAAAPAEPVPSNAKLVAHVVWIKGSFFAKMPGDNTQRALKASSNVYLNDTLLTGNDSQAEIVFTDNSVMTFRPNTNFYINQYNYTQKGDKKEKASVGSYVMNLIEGGFRTVTGYVAKDSPDNYQVNTPVATIGVRGTEFSIVAAKDGKTYMKRYKGVPCVNAKNKTSKHEAVCLREKEKYAEVADANTAPVVLAQEPAQFTVDVDVVPVTFSNQSPGFCGPSGCGSSAGGFCIQ